MESYVDYYEILQCDKNASNEELKRNYQRLALTFHPDKSGDDCDKKFHLIQEAWTVLRDPLTRKLYDSKLACYENNDLLLYNTVSLTDMNFEATEKVYTYECRCSGVYYLEASELPGSCPSEVIISCNECSFCIQVNIKNLCNNCAFITCKFNLRCQALPMKKVSIETNVPRAATSETRGMTMRAQPHSWHYHPITLITLAATEAF